MPAPSTEHELESPDYSGLRAQRRGGRSRIRHVLRALWSWTPIAVLVVLATSSATMAFAVEEPHRAGAQRSDRAATTPIVSVRRVATSLVSGATDIRLTAELDAFVARQAPNTCLTVDLPGFSYDHRNLDPQIPASLMKILTGYAALEVIGHDTRLPTEILAAGPVVDGVLHGALYVRGGGDPLIVTHDRYLVTGDEQGVHTDLGALANQIIAAGITRIEGPIVGDESRWDTERFNANWPGRYITQGQLGPVSALSVNDGFPVDSGTPGLAQAPTRNAALALLLALRERGVTVNGGFDAGPTPKDARRVLVAKSAPVRDLVGQMLRQSDNGTAEALLKEIGLRHSGTGSFAAGAAAMHEVLAPLRAGSSTPAGRSAPAKGEKFRAIDGSGLSTGNAVTCELIGAVLSDPKHAQILEAGLAVAGETGTLRNRWRGTDLARRVRAKTGTLRTVRSLAGYVDSRNGSPGRAPATQFVYIVNVEQPAQITYEAIEAQQELAEILMRYPDVIDIGGLLPTAN